MNERAGFGARLRWWRNRRGLSQLALAEAAEISQRHLSFLEVARNSPSRDMVLRLGAALDLPLREQNALLGAAGFAPVWRTGNLGEPALAAVGRALDFMLAQQEPYPAYVVDRRWRLIRANEAGQRLVSFLTGTAPAPPDPENPVNLADALVAPTGLRPLIENWRDVVLYFIRSVRADAQADGSAETASLLERLIAYPDVPAIWESAPIEDGQGPVLTIDFAKGGTRLKMFTTLATLGTAQDVTLQEIRVECFFPADEATAAVFKAWAATSHA
jgi:transcriptional regulator with XRE-family HTH domain